MSQEEIEVETSDEENILIESDLWNNYFDGSKYSEIPIRLEISADDLLKVLDYLDWENKKRQGPCPIDKNNSNYWREIATKIGITKLAEFCDESDDNTTSQIISWDDVCRHNQRDDCWIVIDGKVYDVSQYIPHHPGGDRILFGISADSTCFFELYHKSQRAFQMLKKFHVGNLAKEDIEKMPAGAACSEYFLLKLRSVMP
eukprot:TRINITY_DN15119_c0_g1_i1.p1 TRINITY_DN15119_c0_g1~~TRINITY_DN15119_c0_g1_i1.p1  ORF type:complete len:201 (-),score=53.28 TRINITY_DN15119_c0_g1_i1:5-607(-)